MWLECVASMVCGCKCFFPSHPGRFSWSKRDKSGVNRYRPPSWGRDAVGGRILLGIVYLSCSITPTHTKKQACIFSTSSKIDLRLWYRPNMMPLGGIVLDLENLGFIMYISRCVTVPGYVSLPSAPETPVPRRKSGAKASATGLACFAAEDYRTSEAKKKDMSRYAWLVCTAGNNIPR
ncbi:hypothetical protein F4804DRAFT_215766 [Jackrogersella minutella]|nr:hypothetical protein F4804DRAFT_215766 [Jackrogersella minutella]